jgi:GTPase SAR1 family protein
MFFKKPIRTIGIEVEPMLVKDNLKISLWDLGGQDEFHAFHDLVVPNLMTMEELVLLFHCAKSYAMKSPIMKSIWMKLRRSFDIG